MRTHLCGHQTYFICRYLPPMGYAGEKPELDIKPPFGALLLIYPRRYLVKTSPQGDTSVRQRWLESRDYNLLVDLTKVIEPDPPVCQLYR